MAIARPLLFALIGALALLALVTGMRVIGSGSGQAEDVPQALGPDQRVDCGCSLSTASATSTS